MFDFKSSFKKGLEAAEIAEKNKKEIKGVIEELSSQLDEATNGRVNVRIETITETVPLHLALDNSYKAKSYQVLYAFVPEGNQGLELVKWRWDRNGYPCEITLDEKILIAEDKEGLQQNLSTILADPRVGDKLHHLAKD